MAKLSTAAWVVHDLGLASAFGGQLFGKMALEPAVSAVQDRRQRGEVEDRAWRRFSGWNSAALLASAVTWFVGRKLLSGREVSGIARGLTLVKDGLVGSAVGLGVANIVVGQALAKAQREEEAAAPGILGNDASESPTRVRRLHTAANVLGSVQLGVVAGILAVTSMLAMEGSRSLRFKPRTWFLP
jgi:uncharacterized membrane protein